MGRNTHSQLKSINLPSTLTIIPYGLFLDSAIETISLPSTLEEIGGASFRYSKLKEIKLPNGIRRIGGYAFQPCPLSKIRLPKTIIEPILENTFSSTEIEYEIALVPGGYLLFDTDTIALKEFMYAKSKKDLPMTDEDYLEFIENKTLLKKHFVFVAFLRSLIYDNDLSSEIKEQYISIVKSQKKRLLVYLASNNHEDYIKVMLDEKIATKKDVEAVRKQISAD